MPKSKSKARATSPEQHQEVDFEEEGEEEEAEYQQDEQASTVSLQKEVKDLSAKLNQVLGAVEKLTKQVNSLGMWLRVGGLTLSCLRRFCASVDRHLGRESQGLNLHSA